MPTTNFPRRDPAGRITRLPDLLGAVLAGLVICLVVLVLVDGIAAAVSDAPFGSATGFFAGILPVWLFLEQFRAWAGVPLRAGLALVAGSLAVVAALLVAGFTAALPHLASGTLGVALGVLLYALLWHAGIGYLAGRDEER